MSTKLRELLDLLEQAKCPNCDGSGKVKFYGTTTQTCPFCAKRKELLGLTDTPPEEVK